jgi:hypothetical protein
MLRGNGRKARRKAQARARGKAAKVEPRWPDGRIVSKIAQ